MSIKEVRERIDYLLKHQGLSVYTVAKEIGIAGQTLNVFSLGGNVSMKTFEKIEKYLESLEEE